MANISETILSDGGLEIILNKYELARLQHINLRSHQLGYIKRNWSFEQQLEFILNEKIKIKNQLLLAKPDVIKIHILLEFYTCYISRLQICIEFAKAGLEVDRSKIDEIAV